MSPWVAAAGLLAVVGCAAPPPPQPVKLMPDGRPYPQVVRCCGWLGNVLTGTPDWYGPDGSSGFGPVYGWGHGYGRGYGGRGYGHGGRGYR